MPKTIETKKEEAEERQAEHNKRSAEQQLALLEHRPGNSTNERHKLMRRIEKANDR